MLEETISYIEEHYKELLKQLGDDVVESLKSEGYSKYIKDARMDGLETLVVTFDDDVVNDGKQDLIGTLAYGGGIIYRCEGKDDELIKVPPNDLVKQFIEVKK
jgi:hypothetical protein